MLSKVMLRQLLAISLLSTQCLVTAAPIGITLPWARPSLNRRGPGIATQPNPATPQAPVEADVPVIQPVVQPAVQPAVQQAPAVASEGGAVARALVIENLNRQAGEQVMHFRERMRGLKNPTIQDIENLGEELNKKFYDLYSNAADTLGLKIELLTDAPSLKNAPSLTNGLPLPADGVTPARSRAGSKLARLATSAGRAGLQGFADILASVGDLIEHTVVKLLKLPARALNGEFDKPKPLEGEEATFDESSQGLDKVQLGETGNAAHGATASTGRTSVEDAADQIVSSGGSSHAPASGTVITTTTSTVNGAPAQAEGHAPVAVVAAR